MNRSQSTFASRLILIAVVGGVLATACSPLGRVAVLLVAIVTALTTLALVHDYGRTR